MAATSYVILSTLHCACAGRLARLPVMRVDALYPPSCEHRRRSALTRMRSQPVVSPGAVGDLMTGFRDGMVTSSRHALGCYGIHGIEVDYSRDCVR